MQLSKKIVVCGHVQGVFFRDTTRAQARALELTGGVRNLRNGCVEVFLYGEENLVLRLIKWLKIGPKHAKVTTIDIEDYPVTAEPDYLRNQFTIWQSKY